MAVGDGDPPDVAGDLADITIAVAVGNVVVVEYGLRR